MPSILISVLWAETTTTLYVASSRAHKAVARVLLEEGVDVHAGGYYGNILLAVSAGRHEAVVWQLLEQGADVNAQGVYYGNPIQAASAEEHDADG